MMKLLLAASLGALVSGAANATHFTFTDLAVDQASGAGLITGWFDGDLGADGIITNLSKASVFIDGTALAGNGAFYVERADATCPLEGYCDGGAQASLDGSQNNFAFIDSDYAAGDTNYTSYYYSFSGIDQDSAFDKNSGAYATSFSGTYFSAQIASVPEPASWALMLGGFGVVGGALRRRRKAALAFA